MPMIIVFLHSKGPSLYLRLCVYVLLHTSRLCGCRSGVMHGQITLGARGDRYRLSTPPLIMPSLLIAVSFLNTAPYNVCSHVLI